MINKKQTSDYAAWKNLVIFPVVALIFAAFSCDNNNVNKKNSAKDQIAPDMPTQIKIDDPDERPFAVVEQMPEFPGGEKAMMKFIQKEMQYPESAKATGVQGTVIVNFIVDKTGKIKDAKVLKGIPVLDVEALRVLNLMPDWQPGKQGGKAVSVNYNIPFKFTLN